MLQLKNITKVYKTGELEQKALAGISASFKQGEFVSILGPSGCGKTTTLNIVGGLDRYTEGDLIINGKTTKEFKDADWDAYRNNSIGFVFQNYNLIGHLSILANVELGMTLSGVNADERKYRALEVLDKVGIKEHAHKKPNQLSGGQKQRVAIARALANNPDIILADEPTGALDSKTSVGIMELIKEISKEKLVIMVTHNSKLAEEYSSRIIRLKDGLIIEDTKPQRMTKKDNSYKQKKTSMNFFTAIKLSFNNLKTKLGRSLLVSAAGSIGIIGVALVLAISNGFSGIITDLETETLAGLPITISEGFDYMGPMISGEVEAPEIEDENAVTPYDPESQFAPHLNTITQEYIDYVGNLNEAYYNYISYQYAAELNFLLYDNISYTSHTNTELEFEQIPSTNILEENYEVLSGNLPTEANQVVFIVDEYNRASESLLSSLGFDITENVDFGQIVETEIVLVNNNDFYNENAGIFTKITSAENLQTAYTNGTTLTISGVLRINQDDENVAGYPSSGLLYNSEVIETYIQNSSVSDVVVAQVANTSINVITNQVFPLDGGATYKEVLDNLGYNTIANSISIYPMNFDSKEAIKNYLDKWNEDLLDEDKITYTDLAKSITGMLTQMVDMISIVLIAFAAISLVVSSIMIGIITYVSVIERTKEIGVLRSLGARKKDISRVFNAETIIIGFAAGVIGILATYALSAPLNILLGNALEQLKGVVSLPISYAAILILISMTLTLIAGLIPARMASKKDPVEALRTE